MTSAQLVFCFLLFVCFVFGNVAHDNERTNSFRLGRKILQSNYETYINWGDDPAKEPDDGSSSIWSTLLYIILVGIVVIAVIGIIALVVAAGVYLYKTKFSKKKGIPGSDTNYVLMEHDT